MTQQQKEITIPTAKSAFSIIKEATNGHAPAPQNGAGSPPVETKAEEAKPETPAVKILKARLADKEIEIPEEAKFKQTVEGEGEVEFTAKDALNSFKTRRQIDRRFAELDKEKKDVEKRRTQLQKEIQETQRAKKEIEVIDEALKRMSEEAKNGNALAALEIALVLGNVGEEGTKTEALVKKMEEIATEYSNMSDEERKLKAQERKLLAEKRKIEQERSDLNNEAAKVTLRNHVEGIKQKLQLTDEDLNQSLEVIDKYNEERIAKGEQPVLLDRPKEEIAEVCAGLAVERRFHSRVRSVIEKIDPKEAENYEFVSAVKSIIEPGYSDEDISEIVGGYLGKSSGPFEKSSKEVAETEAHSETRPEPTAKTAPPERLPKKEPETREPILSFADLIKKYS